MKSKILMAEVVPAILADDAVDYGHKLKKLSFAKRLHIDIAAPPFAPTRTINLAQLHLTPKHQFDLHLMLQQPLSQIETVISLKPALAIIHHEADGNLAEFIHRASEVGIKTGLALLPETEVDQAEKLIKLVDHVLIFTGNLGHYGGELKTDCLPKIKAVKQIKEVEVSVDGGINPDNAAEVVDAGADVLISGGFIANADHPAERFEQLAGAAEVYG